ncbi:MAG: efflux RND transporter periplasmic adaptor subunit [Hyphomicrobiaceae bacterium]
MRKLWLSAFWGTVAAATAVAYVHRQDLGPAAEQLYNRQIKPLTEKLTSADKTASPAPGQKSGRSGAPPAPVTAAVADSANLPIILSAPGTVEPLATVALKPRVDGQIVEVSFKEGDLVQEKQILFRLDDRLVKAQIRQAEANVAKDQATLKDAESNLDRRLALVKQKYVTEASTETAKHTVEGLKASIVAGQAMLDAQKTQLDYLIVRAPITGRTGNVNAKLGATVRTGDAVPLVTIHQTKPIAVGFSVPQSEIVALRRALSAQSPAEITVAGDKPAKVHGTLGFVDNQVDKQTGTILAKVTVENADEMLWPGLAVVVDVLVATKPNVIAVPSSAVLPSQLGMLVWVIGSDNKVTPRPVTVERIVEQTAFLAKGLKAGERVVTDGHLRLAPGATVTVRESGDAAPPPAASERPAGRERRANGRS